MRILAISVALAVTVASSGRPAAQSAPALPTPGFHHLHLNSINPDAAIDFYTRQFPATSRGTFAGNPALKSPNNVWVLFNKVETPPATQPETAFWHFGWHVTDVRKSLELYKQHAVTLLPLYAEDNGRSVFISSDTWPGTGGVLGLTKSQIAEAKARGTKPNGGAGFAYLRGPDDATIEYQGNMPVERFNHVHMYEDQPFCALIWYQTHLNVQVAARGNQPARTEANCKVERGPDKTFPALDADGMYRTPSLNAVAFGDVSFYWYMNQGDKPAASTRGHLMDHVGLSVANLDAWIAKLRSERVTFLQEPYTVGENRAVMIEGPSREAIELIEVK
ncbi:MAG TPA: VOC family protein [Vicinamibacterales bacterium]|jgi:catechol 2,3-dioxygenase-like lactoylglutathione lyase family enzyme